ncbi:hypothetical protein LJR153_007314 [Paenibacillus sp. LjRoot153]|uniref:hypothetical protein n=1 Tax=Paenibacillus sp. LjRoot153 TaxID=3342270 RepID=UPI003ECCC990
MASTSTTDILRSFEKTYRQKKDITLKYANYRKIAMIELKLVYYGVPDQLITFFSEIEQEWDFIHAHFQLSAETKALEVNYQIKPAEMDSFLRRVPPRHEDILIKKLG